MSLLVQLSSPIHIIRHPKTFEKKFATRKIKLLRKSFTEKNSQKKEKPKEKERHKHETSKKRHLQKTSGEELF